MEHWKTSSASNALLSMHENAKVHFEVSFGLESGMPYITGAMADLSQTPEELAQVKASLDKDLSSFTAKLARRYETVKNMVGPCIAGALAAVALARDPGPDHLVVAGVVASTALAAFFVARKRRKEVNHMQELRELLEPSGKPRAHYEAQLDKELAQVPAKQCPYVVRQLKELIARGVPVTMLEDNNIRAMQHIHAQPQGVGWGIIS